MTRMCQERRHYFGSTLDVRQRRWGKRRRRDRVCHKLYPDINNITRSFKLGGRIASLLIAIQIDSNNTIGSFTKRTQGLTIVKLNRVSAVFDPSSISNLLLYTFPVNFLSFAALCFNKTGHMSRAR